MKNAGSILAGLIFMSMLNGLHAQSEDPKLDQYFSKKMQKAGLIGLQAASIGNGELVWQGSFGLKEIHTSDAVNDSTLFQIASCSKPVTSLGIMLLYDRGMLDLDADVNTYLPFEIRNPHHPETAITLRMLLSHTSSLRDNWGVYDTLYTLPEGGDSPLLLRDFVREYFTPGGIWYHADKNFARQEPKSSFQYCNMGYATLGVVIEQVSGQSFNDFMREEIFEPLGMHDSYWFLNEIPHENIARPHRIRPSTRKDPHEPEVLNHFGYPSYPDGQLRTTVKDYAQVVKLMINEGRLNGQAFLKKSTADEYLRVQYPEINKYQAICWNYNEFESTLYYLLMPRLPSHTGADPGIATVVSFDPDKKTGAVIFSNSPTLTFGGQKIFYQEFIKRLLRKGRNSTVHGGSSPAINSFLLL
jgi:CubicO group peptidase (beta-lactamase class C family)